MPYAIRCTPHYFAGDIHGRDKEFLVTGSPPFADYVTIVLETAQDAETLARIMNWYSSRGCYLNQNQYEQPEYAAVPYKGKVPAQSLSAAMWVLGYGLDENGEFLGGDELRKHFDRIVTESAS